jgi:hypothetical protein
MDRYLDSPDSADSGILLMIETARCHAGERFSSSYSQWRAWTFRDWRLARYIETRPNQSGSASCG